MQMDNDASLGKRKELRELDYYDIYRQLISYREYSQCIKKWLEKKIKFDESSEDKFEIPETNANQNKFEFQFLINFLIGGYKVVLSYYCNKHTNEKEPRAFYFSGSEAVWRSFTGWRADGSWMKGAEKGNYRTETSNGYIFECIVDDKLAEAIEKFFKTNQFIVDTENICPDKKILGELSSKVILKGEKRINEYNRCYTASLFTEGHISNDYDTERVYIHPIHDHYLGISPSVITAPMIHEHYSNYIKYLVDRGANDIEILDFEDLIKEVIDSMKFSSTEAQRQYGVHMYFIKKLYELWSNIIVKNITAYTNQKFPILKHEALNTNYAYEQYNFSVGEALFAVQIAYTVDKDNKPRKYKFDVNKNPWEKYTVETPICWIRNAYVLSFIKKDRINNFISSFGNKKYCSIDLAFIVQKPIDYKSQISKRILREINTVTTVNDDGKFDNDKTNPLGKYHHLAVFNERTSPIIRKFKKDHGFSLFFTDEEYIAKMKENINSKDIFVM